MFLQILFKNKQNVFELLTNNEIMHFNLGNLINIIVILTKMY